MPLTRITLSDSVSDASIHALSAILHQTLVETFAVPPQDRFQIVEKLPAAQRLYDRHYLSGTRSDGFILFTLIAGKARTTAQKAAFYRTLTQRLARELAINPDDVMVVMQFNTPEDWSFSNGVLYAEEPQ